MKKIVSLILVLMMVLSAITACSSVDFTISFMVDGEEYSSISTNGKEVIKMPQDPKKEGYVFKGWFWDNGSWQKPFTANSLLDAPLSSNMKVYACFSKSDENLPNEDQNDNGDSVNEVVIDFTEICDSIYGTPNADYKAEYEKAFSEYYQKYSGVFMLDGENDKGDI